MKMKKIIITALAVSAAMLSCGKMHACTNLLITKGAMKDSSNVITYSADSHTRYGFLTYLPGGRHRANAMREIYDWGSEKYLGSIPEARRTYNVVGNMNEHQLIIGESTWEGLKSHRDPDGMIDYGSMMFIALQRCRTAREAIKTMTSLANEYGYASSGESFSIADKNEVWILELISKKPKYDQDSVNINKGIVWVAIRIPDGCISAHANAARITEIPADDSLNCMYAPDIFSYVKEEKLYDGPDSTFSFADTFCPLDFLLPQLYPLVHVVDEPLLQGLISEHRHQSRREADRDMVVDPVLVEAVKHPQHRDISLVQRLEEPVLLKELRVLDMPHVRKVRMEYKVYLIHLRQPP